MDVVSRWLYPSGGEVWDGITWKGKRSPSSGFRVLSSHVWFCQSFCLLFLIQPFEVQALVNIHTHDPKFNSKTYGVGR